MDIEDFEPLKQPKPKKNLDEMSIEALHVYIIELEEEIERTRGSIKAKEAAKLGAESFFKK
jgi:uncharacterized small protein (DUF1192 family)